MEPPASVTGEFVRLAAVPPGDRWPPFRLDVSPYDPAWPDLFEQERARLEAVLGREHDIAIHHVGSTSIRGMPARPIIDYLVLAPRTALLRVRAAIVELGYPFERDTHDEGHYFLGRGAPVRTHHAHVTFHGHPFALLVLALRDYLRVHPEDAAAYAEHKRAAADGAADGHSYVTTKMPFLQVLNQKALSWQETVRATRGD